MGDSHIRRRLGKQGEDTAAIYLQKQGYRILTRNYRVRAGEIDIICWRDLILVFVEVKTRMSISCGTPEESITAVKQGHIRRVALAYLEGHTPAFTEIRFDVIAITMSGAEPVINHIQGAF